MTPKDGDRLSSQCKMYLGTRGCQLHDEEHGVPANRDSLLSGLFRSRFRALGNHHLFEGV